MKKTAFDDEKTEPKGDTIYMDSTMIGLTKAFIISNVKFPNFEKFMGLWNYLRFFFKEG